MAYAAMMVVDQRVLGIVGNNAHPEAFTLMLAHAPKTDGIAHLFEFNVSDITGHVDSWTMDKKAVTVEADA